MGCADSRLAQGVAGAAMGMGVVTLGTHVLWKHRSFLAIEDCLGGDLVEQVTFGVGFGGWLGIHRLERSRDESQKFFRLFMKSHVYLHT